MSFPGSRNCKCPRYSFNVGGKPKREWIVIQRRQNRSTYHGARWDADHSTYDCVFGTATSSH